MEKKYGGKLEDLKEYWPPRSTNEEFDAIKMLKLQEDKQTEDELFSVCNDLDFFDEKSEGVCGQASCTCRTF